MSVIAQLGGTELAPTILRNNRQPIDYGHGRLLHISARNSMLRRQSAQQQKELCRDSLIQIMVNTKENMVELERLSQRAHSLNVECADDLHEKAMNLGGFYRFLEKVVKAVDDNKVTLDLLRDGVLPAVKDMEKWMKHIIGL